jgi:hypothetical protein
MLLMTEGLIHPVKEQEPWRAIGQKKPEKVPKATSGFPRSEN